MLEKLKKPLLIVCGGFVILFIFLFVFSSCNKTKYTTEEFTDYLLTKAKNYYKTNSSSLPQTNGGKISVNILSLISEQEDYLNDASCSGNIEIVNNNGYYMFAPNINCSDGFATQKLSDYIINKDLVTSSNGLYQFNDYYIYRGDTVNNYVVFNNQVYRILRINADGSIRLIETDYKTKKEKSSLSFKKNRRSSVKWDDRYNSEKNYQSGFNDYIHNEIDSRIKVELENIYKNDFKDDVKAYIVPQDLCIGKRALNETINDGSIECATTIPEQYVGLLPVYEYLNVSLDSDCIDINSNACSNYNYLQDFKSSYWSMTAVNDNTHGVYKISNRISDATASSLAIPRIVIHLSNEVRFSKGDGSSNNPYILY